MTSSSSSMTPHDPLLWQQKLEKDTQRLITLQRRKEQNISKPSSSHHKTHQNKGQIKGTRFTHQEQENTENIPIVVAAVHINYEEEEEKESKQLISGEKHKIKPRLNQDTIDRLSNTSCLKLSSSFKSGKADLPNFRIDSLDDGYRFHFRNDICQGFSLIVLDFYLSFGKPRASFPIVAYDA
mmetsp:Transcript_8219/g.9804  ORF Transcript_8219/g.9804 Transcript_8219/m.9804 type:complete len:182 (-) Transcript_8219:820-1365(-)